MVFSSSSLAPPLYQHRKKLQSHILRPPRWQAPMACGATPMWGRAKWRDLPGAATCRHMAVMHGVHQEPWCGPSWRKASHHSIRAWLFCNLSLTSVNLVALEYSITYLKHLFICFLLEYSQMVLKIQLLCLLWYVISIYELSVNPSLDLLWFYEALV